MRIAAIGLALLVCGTVAPAYAQYAEPNITFFYPLLTRRPIIERELEFGLAHAKGREARETEATLAIEAPIAFVESVPDSPIKSKILTHSWFLHTLGEA